MADDSPIVNISLTMPPEGDGGDDASTSVKAPDTSLALGYIARSIDAVSRNVAALLAVTQSISAQMGRIASSVGRAPAAPAARGARAPRAGVAVPAPPRIRAAITPQAPGISPAGVFNNVLGSRSLSGFGRALTPALGLAIGLPLTAAATAVALGMKVRDMAATGLSENARYSPAIAGFQAQVDMTRFMANFRLANDPGVVASSRLYAGVEMRFQTALLGARKVMTQVENYGASAILGAFLLSPFGAALYGIGSLVGQGNNVGTSNREFMRSLNQITGGLLDMQQQPLPGRDGKPVPTRVRYGNGGWERWERSPR